MAFVNFRLQRPEIGMERHVRVEQGKGAERLAADLAGVAADPDRTPPLLVPLEAPLQEETLLAVLT